MNQLPVLSAIFRFDTLFLIDYVKKDAAKKGLLAFSTIKTQVCVKTSFNTQVHIPCQTLSDSQSTQITSIVCWGLKWVALSRVKGNQNVY